jgi:hypothetical protein
LLLWAAGCGGDGGAEKDLQALLGTWTYTSGTTTLTCTGVAPMSIPLSGGFTFEAGTDSDLVGVPTGKNCPLKFDVAGSVASLRPGQSCEFVDGINVTLSSWKVTSDGKTNAQSAFAGTAAGTQGSLRYMCPMDGSGALVRAMP